MPTGNIQTISPSRISPDNPTIDTSSNEPTRIPLEVDMELINSIDENLLVFSTLQGIYSISLETSDIVVLQNTMLIDKLSVTDNYIYYLFSKGGMYGFGPAKVFRMKWNGSNEEQLTFGMTSEGSYSVSPNEGYLIFTSNSNDIEDENRFSISLLDLSTRNVKVISHSAEDPFMALSWSPDGKKLVFAKISGTTNESYLLTYEIDTGKLIELPIENRAINYLYGWSPDGMHLAFSMNDQEVFGFFLYDITNSSFEKIYTFEKEPYSIAWSNDGNKILLETLYDVPQDATYVRLELIDIRTGEAMTIEEGSVKSGFSHQPRWLSAENYFAYDMDLEDDHWAIVIVDCSTMKKFIFELPSPYSGYPSSWIITKGGE